MKPLTKRKQQAAATKQKIFTCAINLFANNSYENITVNDICRDAEVSVGAFYHHFKNKENILNEGYCLFDEQIEEQWNSGHPEQNLEAVRFLIACQLNSINHMGVLAAAQYFKNQISNEEKYILNEDRFFFKMIYNAIHQEVAAGSLIGNTQTITEDILGISRGIIYDWCLHEGSYDLLEKGHRACDMVLFFYSLNLH